MYPLPETKSPSCFGEAMKPSIVLGIGSGRCGTESLAAVLNRHPGVKVSHEEPPLLPWRHEPEPRVIGERLARFQRRPEAQLVGDVASFYLPYVEDAIRAEPTIRIVCLKRDREEVVQSFCRWLDRTQHLPTNHWAEQPAPGWHHDPVWTAIFPKYGTANREEGIRLYWDAYYATVEQLLRVYPQQIRLFDMQHALNTKEGLRDLLTFAGIPSEQQILAVGTVCHRSSRPSMQERGRASTSPTDPRRCVILVPFSGQIHPQGERSLQDLERRGYAVQRVGGYAAIDQGRSQMATDALRAGFAETMWIDADIGFSPDAVERLRSHNMPMVCGIYPQKGRREIACHVLQGTPKIVFGQGGGLVELQYAATGFLHVRREVYERMQQYLELPICNERFGRPTIPFFQPMVHPWNDGHWYLAEDYAFCERARQCGFRPMADTTIRLWHFGSCAYGWEDAGIERQRYASFTLRLSDEPNGSNTD